MMQTRFTAMFGAQRPINVAAAEAIVGKRLAAMMRARNG